MLKIVNAVRRWNHARLERRRRVRAAGGTPAGAWISRLGRWLRGRNRNRLARRRARRGAGSLLESLAANDTSILEALVFLVRAEQQERAAREEATAAAAAKLAALEERVTEGLRGAATRPEFVEQTGRRELFSPELDLITSLAPLIEGRTALDVGANIGEVSAVLLDAGFAVHAFEPAPSAFEELTRRLGARRSFSAHPVAVGRDDGSADLHLAKDLSGGKYEDASLFSSLLDHATPPDLPFTAKVRVPVRSLDSLHRAGEIPADVGLVKIDAEGLDLDVIRGMGERSYPLVMAEYWDPEFPFARTGASNRLDDLVAEMRRRGYPWHIVLYRVWGRDGVAWYANRATSVERSWGNLLFFKDWRLFASASRWCAGSLPAARFVPRQPAEARGEGAKGDGPAQVETAAAASGRRKAS